MSDTDMGERIDKPEVHDNVVWNDDEKIWAVHIRIVHAGGVETVNKTFAPLAAVQAREVEEAEFDREVAELDRVEAEDAPRPMVEVQRDPQRDGWIVNRWGRDHERVFVEDRLAADIMRDHFPRAADVAEALHRFFRRELDRDVLDWNGMAPRVEINPDGFAVADPEPPPEPFRVPMGDEIQRADRLRDRALDPPERPRNLFPGVAERRGRGPGGFLEDGRRRQAHEAQVLEHDAAMQRIQERLLEDLNRNMERGVVHMPAAGEELPQVIMHNDVHAGQPIDVQELDPRAFDEMDLLPDRPFGEEDQIAIDVERAEDRAMGWGPADAGEARAIALNDQHAREAREMEAWELDQEDNRMRGEVPFDDPR